MRGVGDVEAAETELEPHASTERHCAKQAEIPHWRRLVREGWLKPVVPNLACVTGRNANGSK
jgi:hypothetical protein